MSSPTPHFNPFPLPYHAFFTIVEPAFTVGGVIYSVFSPLDYHQHLLPFTVAPMPLASEVHQASIMGVRQLGSCFSLFALLAIFLLRRIYNVLRDHPEQMEAIIAVYLRCLGFADITHICFTFYDVGMAGTLDWKNWNTLIWGNCVITAGLFIVRVLWFAGVGRGSAQNIKKLQ